nr:substrate-binding domain-containing protein [Lachnospiraceae bacterium]
MKKRVMATVIAAAMVLGLSACGQTAAPAPAAAAPAEESAPAEEAPAKEEAPAGEAPAKEEAPAEEASSGDIINIGFAQVGHESDWRTASTKSCQDVFSEANGYNLSFVDCDNDSAAQLEAVRSFIEQDVDYIIIDPIVSTGWDTVLGECEDAGIPVIVIDRTIEDSDKYVSWVGSDFLTEGKAAGEWLKAYADAQGIKEINALIIQ